MPGLVAAVVRSEDVADARPGLPARALVERSPLADMMRRAESCPAYCPALTRPVPYPFHML